MIRFISSLYGLALAAALAGVAFYVSRFWTLNLWPREGLGGVEALRPGGDLLRREWRDVLKGSGLGHLNAFDILLWAGVVFALLSILHAVLSRVSGMFIK